ncbi:MAG TPA: patatin-like phospholipase family protein [Polyangiales bacterium]|nr:patatin-like phospholipase family protein [Polyangiales bacterium]
MSARASHRAPPTGPRTALCLCGGGVTGAMYEVGCLAALEDFFEGFSASDFDVYVGSGAGSSVAVALAGGLRASRLYRALLDPADDFFSLKRNDIFGLDFGEWRRVTNAVVGAGRRAAASFILRPLETDVWNELERFVDSLPAGLFSIDPYEQFFREFMERRAIAPRFSSLPKPLALVAHDLDAGARTVFGAQPLLDVPVAEAVAASCAIPVLFAPVRLAGRDYIDGGLGDVAHIDVAVELGAEAALIVNPMVPIRSEVSEREIPTGHGRMRRVRDKGLLWVYNQAFRIRSDARLHDGLARYRREHPERSVVLLEPDPSDATLFMHSPMNFAARRAILTHAYTTTYQALRVPSSELRKLIEGRGFTGKE